MSDVMLYGVLRMPYEMAMGDELSRWQFWQRAQEAADRLEAAEARNTASPAAPAGQQKFAEPGYSDSLADCVFNLPCNWKGDPALHSAILMGHTMACEQAYNLVMAATASQSNTAGSAEGRKTNTEDCRPQIAEQAGDAEDAQDVAEAVAIEVLNHIDTMYPAMWVAVAKSARTSIRNTIIGQSKRFLAAIAATKKGE